MDLPDLRLLAPLDALLQEGSVSGAARRLGLSTPAMSHALVRLRAALGDPLLVRAGRGMALTPRAEAIKDDVHSVVLGASRLLVPAPAVEPAALSRSFVVHASDYVLRLLGAGVDAALGAALPLATLRFLPNSPDDPAMLREGGSDLAVGIYGALPDEMRSRPLLTDRFVVVARVGHPLAAGPLTLEAYLGAAHLQVAPRGLPGGYVDDLLRALGHSRAVTRAVPYFMVAAALASESDLLLTLPERLAGLLAPSLGLVVLEAPLPLRPYALSLVWHPRLDGDPAHRLLRGAFVLAAQDAAAQRHPDARTRLDPSDPTSGEGRRRAPKAGTLHGMKG